MGEYYQSFLPGLTYKDVSPVGCAAYYFTSLFEKVLPPDVFLTGAEVFNSGYRIEHFHSGDVVSVHQGNCLQEERFYAEVLFVKTNRCLPLISVIVKKLQLVVPYQDYFGVPWLDFEVDYKSNKRSLGAGTKAHNVSTFYKVDKDAASKPHFTPRLPSWGPEDLDPGNDMYYEMTVFGGYRLFNYAADKSLLDKNLI